MVYWTNICHKKKLKNHGNPSITGQNTFISFRRPNKLVFLRHFVISKQLYAYGATYRHCSHAWLEDVCKVLRHNSYCKWAIEATMVWCTPANKTPRLSSVIVVSCCVQTNSPCHVKSLGIVPMHACFHFLVGYWGWDKRRTPWSGGGYQRNGGNKNLRAHTY